jgi:serine/threonine protein kinase
MATTDQNTDNPHGPPADLDYQVVRLIGQGGYGEVWLVRDKGGDYRACKVVYRESFHHARPYEREYEGILRFEPVSRASPSQVKILYVGQRAAAGYFFYIMELADDAGGAAVIQPETYVPRTLRTELERRGRLPATECIQLGLSLSAALQNLHSHGLIHRDVKPANIIFVKGIPKLADIGLVTDADVTASYVGTGGFIPPEGPGSEPADVYALGKALYEISTGKDRLEYPELPADFGEWPDHAMLLEFNAVVAKACEADVRKRYASAAEMGADLALLLSGKSVRQLRLSIRNSRMAAKMVAALALALVVAMGVIYFPNRRTPSVEPPPRTRLAHPTLPDAVRLGQSEAKIREAYQAQLAGGTGAAKQQAAFELLDHSGTAEDPATELASLRVASLLATEAGNFSLAMQICDTMAERFPISSLPVKAELLSQAGRDQQTAARKPELAGFCVKIGFQAIGADDYETGTNLDALAGTAAANSGDARLIQEAGFLDQEMTRCRDGFERVKVFEGILRTRPDDAEASEAVGNFLSFVKNDWETGLPLMARGTNDALKPILAAEVNEKTRTTDQQIALANAWGHLAGAASSEDKTHYYGRARYWSLKAITPPRSRKRPGSGNS